MTFRAFCVVRWSMAARRGAFSLTMSSCPTVALYRVIRLGTSEASRPTHFFSSLAVLIPYFASVEYNDPGKRGRLGGDG